MPFKLAGIGAAGCAAQVQGLVLGSISHKHGITALVDKDDVHCLMISASGVRQSGLLSVSQLWYAPSASGTRRLSGIGYQGDLARNYGAIADNTMATMYPW